MTKDKIAIVAGCTMITLLLFGYSAYLFSNAPAEEKSVHDNLAEKVIEKPIIEHGVDIEKLPISDPIQVDINAVRYRYNKAFGKKENDSITTISMEATIIQKPESKSQKGSVKTKKIQKPKERATKITTEKYDIKEERPEPKKEIRKRTGLGPTLVFDNKSNSTNDDIEDFTSPQIAAEIPVKVNFQEGTTIPIRTLGTCSIEGKEYPSGTKLIALGKITKNRILLNVESLILDNSTQNVALKVYATDGILGLPYDSGDARFSEAGSKAVGQVIRQINLPVVGTVSIPRKQKKTVLEMPAGYPIYLKP